MPNATPRNQLRKLLESRPSRREFEAQFRMVRQFVVDHSKTLQSENFTLISETDLGLLFHITDEVFFDGLLSTVCEQQARPLAFRLSKRMTKVGGMTTMYKPNEKRKSTEFEIAIATTPLFETFTHQSKTKVAGLKCTSRLEALQRIMEHEMIHLAELLIWEDSNCSARRFRGIAKRFFSHRESNHQMLTPADVARKSLGIRPGDRVRFQQEGRLIVGYVNRITKRATVLVPDRSGTLYDDGQKYCKYYVPIHMLRRAA